VALREVRSLIRGTGVSDRAAAPEPYTVGIHS
jgi:hypothetical protein